MKDQFIKFLKANKCLTIFKQNFKRKAAYFDYFFIKTAPNDYIDFAFVWQPTLQGWDFWHELNIKWKEQLKSNQ